MIIRQIKTYGTLLVRKLFSIRANQIGHELCPFFILDLMKALKI